MGKAIMAASVLAFSMLALGANTPSPSPKPDSLDIAEAQRRGIPVENVQLEHAYALIASLNNEIATLRRKVASLTKDLAAARSEAVKAHTETKKTEGPKPPEIGMTEDEVKKLGGTTVVSETADSKILTLTVVGLPPQSTEVSAGGSSASFDPTFQSVDSMKSPNESRFTIYIAGGKVIRIDRDN